MPSSPLPSPDAANSGSPLPDGETWLTSPDLAARWRIPLKTIASWASAGTGPRYSHLGRHRRYRLAAVRAWERQRLRETTPGNATEPAPAATADDEKWLTTADLAQRMQIPAKTLAGWASDGTGPRYARLGRHRRYRLADIRAWERQRPEVEPIRLRRSLP
ncbi:helix-turn-helix transcriptional regulator [Nocardia sp. NPDC058497]|uniref:helix-turn-helix transcriptional regulator n=1 Tax=Nocardia sp. NPDC058497 TaxID=3346529 RepID=UPI003650647D